MQAGNLQSLRHVPYPAFLWDVVRRRVIWANAAAVAWFGAHGLADLVERPFDGREAGVRVLTETAEQLRAAADSNKSLRAALHFPSSGQEDPLRARLSRCLLADGREALLVVGEQPASTARPRVMSEILDEIPQPVLALTPAGEPLFANAAALDLLGTDGLLGEQGLFRDAGALRAFLMRARDAGTAMDTRDAETRAGHRILRLTARAAADDDLIIVMINDITDRLRAERGELPEIATDAVWQAADLDTHPVDKQKKTAQQSVFTTEADDEVRQGATPAALQPEELTRLRQMMMALERPVSPASPASTADAEDIGAPSPAVDGNAVVEEPDAETTGVGPTAGKDADGDGPAVGKDAGTSVEVEETESAADAQTATSMVREQEADAGPPARRSRISIRVKKNTAPDTGKEAAGQANAAAPSHPEEQQPAGAGQLAGMVSASEVARMDSPGKDASAAASGMDAGETNEPAQTREQAGKPASEKQERQPWRAGQAAQTHQPEQAGSQSQREEGPGQKSAEAPGASAGATSGNPSGNETAPSRTEHPPRPEPPQLVRDVLDHRPEPIILHRSESFYFANRAASDLFGYDTDDPAWDDIARALANSHDGMQVQLPAANGELLCFTLKRDVFPWRAGVVVQSTLRPPAGDRDGNTADPTPSPLPPQDGAAPSGTGRSISIPATGAAQGENTRQAARRTPAPVIRIHTDPGGKAASVGGSTNKTTAGDDAPHAALAAATSAPATSVPATSAPATLAADGARHEQPMDEELRAMLETAADGIITLNTRGEILSFSSGAERLFGHAAPRVLGRPFRDLLSEESRPALDVRLARLRQDPAAARQRDEGREVLGLTAEGRIIPLYLTIGVLQHTQPHDIEHRASFCAVVHDISAFKQRERELKQAKEQAEQRSARKSEFLARISHELRTPLNAILGFSDVLRQELFGQLGNEKYRDYARDIYDSGAHLLSLVNDLLDLARIEAGRYELDLKEVDLARIVEESVNILREQAGTAGITLRRVVPEDLPRVVADARSIKQILINLLSNAVKYGREGDSITIALRQRSDGGLELSVKDTGPGMSEEELHDALEPFRRVPRTGEDKPGTGLGLPLAKALAEANRASFEIDSTPGKGTVARIVFPPHRVLA